MEENDLTEEEKAERDKRFTSQEGDLMVIGPEGQPLTGEEALALMEKRRSLLEEYYGKSLIEQYEERVRPGKE